MIFLIPLLSVFVPRLVLFFIWLLSNWFSLSYKTVVWPVLGFLFMPYTTLAYMGAMLKNGGNLSGWWLALFVITVLIDLGQFKAF
jgi:hypothetical protein